MLASLWDLPTELMERQNKHGEHKESRLCVSGIRIRFRWEPIGRFIRKQDTEAEQGRKKSNFFLAFIKTRFKWSKNTNSSNFTFAHYKNGHSDIFFFFQYKAFLRSFFPYSGFLSFWSWVPTTRSTTPVLEVCFFLCHASGRFFQACHWRDGSNWQRAVTVSWKVKSRM